LHPSKPFPNNKTLELYSREKFFRLYFCFCPCLCLMLWNWIHLLLLSSFVDAACKNFQNLDFWKVFFSLYKKRMNELDCSMWEMNHAFVTWSCISLETRKSNLILQLVQ
jgi:hypothetical protein